MFQFSVELHPPTGYRCSLYADVYAADAADYDVADDDDKDDDYDSSNDDDIHDNGISREWKFSSYK